MHPWLLVNLWAIQRLAGCGISYEKGLDFVLLDHARGRKRVVELETPVEQPSVLPDLSSEGLQAYLVSSANRHEAFCAEFEALYRSWRLGDMAGLEAQFYEEVRENPGVVPAYQRLFDDRNVRMADRILVLRQGGGKRLVVVGTGHMVGKKGLIELLARRGYRARQLEAAGETVVLER